MEVLESLDGRTACSVLRHPCWKRNIWPILTSNVKYLSSKNNDNFCVLIGSNLKSIFDGILKAVTLHTDLGDLKLELFCEQVSKACENFLVLCASDYYNGCIFHRNIRGFMVQTGDPTGTGKGGTSIWGRKFEDEFNEHLKHNVRGVVSLANSGPNTNGSQFFITYGKQPHLDMKYTIFGKVIDGLETLDDLEKLPVQDKTYLPLTNTRIKTITIHANPFAP